MTGLEAARFAAREADEKRAEDVVIYDLRGISDVADYFVLATARSKLQIRAIAHAIAKGMKERGVTPLGTEGNADSQWILVDLADVVVHLFSPELRAYYSLESLWGDAPKVAWAEAAAKAGSRRGST